MDGILFIKFDHPGTILWTTYSATYESLDDNMKKHSTLSAAVCGAVAGGVQAVAAAPADNLRATLETGTHREWTQAWKEVFKGANVHAVPSNSRLHLSEVKEIKVWTSELRDMMGRGWHGWTWGVAKDMAGLSQ